MVKQVKQPQRNDRLIIDIRATGKPYTKGMKNSKKKDTERQNFIQ